MPRLLLSSLALGVLLAGRPASAQETPFPTPPHADSTRTVRPAPRLSRVAGVARDTRGPRRLGGPRAGVTVLSPTLARRLNELFDDPYCYDTSCPDDGPKISESVPVITQFGWQFERRLFQAASGLTGVTEWVLLVGGAERGLFLPSGTFMAGVRTPGGLEVGVGPNLSLSGAAYAVTLGFNSEFGEVNVPLNLAVVFGQDGPRASLLVGFNVSDRRW